jgi:hypothetical protein
LLALVVLGACVPPALTDEPPLTALAERTVYLDGPRDLARLQRTNPEHYARAERILARANHLCRPGPGKLNEAAGARDLTCEGTLFRSSNPPKLQITFTLDDTHYVALVAITDDPPRLTRAR